ncbi:AAA family ATPase [Subtercola boreus]|uniref:Nuclease SbcCD subunit C n=1 Tax=Subtercola boreus TaxID=120213 RepID=A0A3E0WDW9_9MICO|nr:SMC family ATPase [Subtercola boreus]RFA22818.1 hypothetical protein B7R24_04245 [Subtercola boreus]RFA23173.1 hypothetical protein B7R23_04240 [Subtercola boreus]RFA28926.1 hypothetical protein B7R25_04255 [Subtercola boreus]
MKIKHLRLAGFGPYKDEQSVDFELFDDDGIFLITGKTGAGKSSILDAICFALYASVPRYDGRESQLRSDHAEATDPTFVELVFGIGGNDYRLYRTPSYLRPKKGRSGTTLAAPEARLEIRESGVVSGADAGAGAGAGWRGVAARPVDVGRYLADILPLKADQFLQVILLAQNRFQQFLLAKTDERRALLRTLFGTSRFEAFEKSLADQSRTLTTQVADARQSILLRARHAAALVGGGEEAPAAAEVPLEPTLEWFVALEAQLEDGYLEAAQRADAASLVAAEAALAHAARQDLLRRQLKRDAAVEVLAALALESEAIEAVAVSVADANRAAQVWPQVEARRSAEQSLAESEAAETAARAAWVPFADTAAEAAPAQPTAQPTVPHTVLPTAQPTAPGLRIVVEELVAQRGALDSAVADEKRIPLLATELEAHTRRRERVSALLDRVGERLRALPAELDELADRLSEAQLSAAALPAAIDRRMTVSVAAEAAARADREQAALTEALLAQKSASSAHLGAARLVDELLARRLSGHAVELAAQLVAGEPCSVCGSVEHPEPATSDAEPVTERDTDEAQERRSERQAELAAADAEVARLRQQLATAREEAGGRSAAALRAELAEADDLVRAAESAAALRDRYEAARATLLAERDAADEQTIELRAQLAAAQADFTATETNRALIALRVSELQGAFESVAARVRAIDAQLDAARTLERALKATEDRREQLDRARAAEAAQLAQLQFADDAAVDSSRLPAREVTRRESVVQKHRDERAAAGGVLSDPDLSGVPDARIDLAPTESALAAAAGSRDETASVRSALAAERKQLGAQVTEARELFRASAGLIEEQGRVRELAELVAGSGSNTKRMRLETYVLAAQLEQIIAAANSRLGTMTGGRYSLELDDSLQYRNVESGLGLSIRDEHTGRARPTHSLSGGETFLASLALALGLAEVVSNQAGGIALDTLFVDEGFGSLDAETLEIAMSTLDSLRTGGRTIGLISHVDSMKEQITAKLRITVTPAGYSEIEEVRERV